MPIVRPVILCVVLPAAVALIVLLATQRGDERAHRGRRTVGVVLAIPLGFVAGYFGVVPVWPSFPPAERWQWMLYLTIAATMAALIQGLLTVRWLQRMLVVVLIAATSGWLLARTASETPWAWIGAVTVSVLAVWLALDFMACRASPLAVSLALWVSATGAAVILVLAGNARLAQLAGALAAVAGALAVVAWFRPGLPFSSGGLVVAAMLIASLMYLGYYYNYSEVPSACFAAPVAVAPAAALFQSAVTRAARRFSPD